MLFDIFLQKQKRTNVEMVVESRWRSCEAVVGVQWCFYLKPDLHCPLFISVHLNMHSGAAEVGVTACTKFVGGNFHLCACDTYSNTVRLFCPVSCPCLCVTLSSRPVFCPPPAPP